MKLLLIFALALVLRIGWISAVQTLPSATLHDTSVYDSLGQHLANGEGLHYAIVNTDGTLSAGSTLIKPPGYPLFLGAVYAVFGHSLDAARLANALAGALAVFPTYWAARRLAAQGVALLACALVAVMPSLIVWTSSLYSESIFTLVFTGAIAALLWARAAGKTDFRLVALTAALIAAGVCIREVALLLIPVALIWLAYPKVDGAVMVKGVVLLAGVPALAVLGWGARNLIVADAPVFTTSSGYNLRVGHAPYSTGTYIRPLDLYTDLGGRTGIDAELFQDREGIKRGLSYAVSHPAREVKLSLLKLGYLWRPSFDSVQDAESQGRTPLGWAHTPVRLTLGLFHAGLGLLVLGWLYVNRRHIEALILPAGLITVWSIGHVVMFALPRYQVPLLPLLCIPAAAMLLMLYDGLRNRDAGPATIDAVMAKP